MKIVILNTSDSKGGAAVASLRLLRALSGAGADARMLVVDRNEQDERIAVAGTPEQRKWAFLSERLKIWICNGFSRRDLFKVSIADSGVDVLAHDWVRQADVVCLNWVNQGMMSLDDVERLCRSGKKIVWTLHDMWCCTGICHHAYGCGRYKDRCGRCPFLRFGFSRDLSYRVWRKKRRIFEDSAVHFVAVSQWLADCCRESSLLAGKPVSVIPNALPVERFGYRRQMPADEKVIAMGAARLDDPVKGFGLMTEAVNRIAELPVGQSGKLRLLLFGDIRDKSLLGRIRLPHEWIGAVAPERVGEIYERCDIVLSASHFETMGYTLAEGLASGCLAVAFDHGGQRDVITHLRNGYLARYPDAADLADGILWAAGQNPDRRSLHEDAVCRFSEKQIAERYMRLFETL